jgi:hypothetical protein
MIERAGLALAALASYREPTRRSLLHRSTGYSAFARHMRVAAAQLGVQFANALFTKRQKY